MVLPPDAVKSAAIAGQTPPSIPAKPEERAASGAAVPIPPADRADIRPLDLPGALKILLGEVRAAMDTALLSVDTSAEPPMNERVDHPQAALQSLVEHLLDAYLTESQDIAEFNQTASRIDSAWQTGSSRAEELVSSWKEVPGNVVDSVREVITAANSLLDDKHVNFGWLRAEWAGLAPRLERYRRRRRRLHRWLTDPDFKDRRLDEDAEPR